MPPTKYPGFTASVLSSRMADRQLSIRELAAIFDCTFEFVRKMMRGDSLPSTRILPRLCKILQLNRVEVTDRIKADRLACKFEPGIWTLVGKNAEMGTLYAWWDALSEGHKGSLIHMATTWAASDAKRDNGEPKQEP